MQRTIGIILVIVGWYRHVNYPPFRPLNNLTLLVIFGIDIGVSSANWTPLIICAAILIIGLVMTFSGKRS